MADMDKVIKALHCCAHTDGSDCMYCPYDNSDEECTALMSMDVLELLKEQEPVCVKEDRINKCVCGNIVNRYYHPKFCGYCGKELIWY